MVDTLGSSRPHLASAVDDVDGNASAGEASVVDALEVVVVDVPLEVALEPGEKRTCR
jgi:hypothetical protein